MNHFLARKEAGYEESKSLNNFIKSNIVTGYIPLLERSINWIWEVKVVKVEFSLKSVLLGYRSRVPCKNQLNCYDFISYDFPI